MTTGSPGPVRFADFTLDPAARTLSDPRGRDIALRRSEFELLRAFLAAPGRALTRDHLLEAVAGRHSDPYDRSIDVLVARLRRKIELEPKRPHLIVTVPGVGYRFAGRPQPASGNDAAPVVPSAPSAARAAVPERRQLTILCCGLSGPALLAARSDPEDLQRLLMAFHACCSEIIQRAGGTVAKRLGETVLAYFGYPETYEDEAERAVRAALRLIDAVAEIETGRPDALQAQAGIATGLVLVGDLFGAGEPALLGEAPDRAARLLARASPRTVLIGGMTRRLVGELFQCREQAPILLEGCPDPLPAWQVLGPGVESRFEALRGRAVADLVGREEELFLLLRRWEQAKAQAGRAVLISGEPGIGKSRLVRAVQERLEGEAVLQLRYFCSPPHRDSPLYPVIAQLEAVASLGREDTAEAKLAKLRALLAKSDANNEAIALLAGLLSIPAGEQYRLPEMGPQKLRERTLQALLDLFHGLAARGPTLVIFEDLH
jgi:class 3 adenylate cyclase